VAESPWWCMEESDMRFSGTVTFLSGDIEIIINYARFGKNLAMTPVLGTNCPDKGQSLAAIYSLDKP